LICDFLLKKEIFGHMNIASRKIVATQWHEVIDRRSREIEEGKVNCRPVEQVVQNIRKKLHARRQAS
jgi:hypothetical protein